MSKHGGYHGLQHCMFFSENKWTSWSTMKSWDGRFSDISNVQRFTRNQWRRRILAATLPCFAQKIHHDFLNGALTISHLKLTQHCTSNLPQSSQHVVSAMLIAGAASIRIPQLDLFWSLPRSASIWNNYWIWVCLKMLCTPKPNGFADHYPY